MSLQRAWLKFQKLGSPTSWDKQARSRLSWGIGFALLAKWMWDSEQENPKFFQEVPTLFGSPKARVLAPDELEQWNSAIAPKDQQLVWKPDKSEHSWQQKRS
eukprot:TRINITY_DN111059_c0_g1_i1.p1 TRINITY_DN111059_c0_g1~~TRINITY_DN111059_c0_g1_i1.p1  ORF type:complete len:102 (+),score=17.50 TRINITY_DN111059_c0_g1_i1:48-353(+)